MHRCGSKNRIWDEKGRPFKPTAAETGLRALGFRSPRQAALTERLWEGKRQAQNYQEHKAQIYEAYRVYLAAPGEKDFEKFKAIKQRVREFNRTLKEHHLEHEVSLITFENMRLQVKKMKRATTRERAMLK